MIKTEIGDREFTHDLDSVLKKIIDYRNENKTKEEIEVDFEPRWAGKFSKIKAIKN